LLSNIRRKRRNPPPDYLTVYIKLNMKNAAISAKGIAAFFCSTESYLFVCINEFYNGIFPLLRAACLILPRVFLFPHKTDKPCFSPGCRSPPFTVRI
jgi:hypothetical protein